MIDIRVDRLARDTNGAVTGVLAARLADRWFPDADWNDLPVVVLTWWMQQVPVLLDGRSARFLFMDGPFSFDVSPTNVGEAKVELFRDCEVIANGVLGVAALRQRIAAAAAQVVTACREHGWSSPDIEQLRLLVTRDAAQQGDEADEARDG